MKASRSFTVLKILSRAIVLWIAIASPVLSEDKPDFSGTWIRERTTDGFTLLSATIGQVATGAATWEGIANSVKKMPDYAVTIRQTANELSIEFVGGVGMNLIPYQLDGLEHATVRDSTTFRGMWTKYVTKAIWQGAALTVQRTAFSDFYTRVDPSTVLNEPEHGGFRNPAVVHVLTRGLDNSQLIITTTLSDEKGNATFRQLFSKVR